MKTRVISLLAVVIIIMTGCKTKTDGLDRAMALRSKLLSSSGYSFDADITADYGDRLYTFSMNCRVDDSGTVAFTVTAPETLAGISGNIGENGGALTFDDTALAFDLLADGQFSPVSAPWLLVHTLCSGYLTSCAEIEGGWMLSIDDRYEDDALNLTVYLGADGLPFAAEAAWQGRRILSLTVKNFTFA